MSRIEISRRRPMFKYFAFFVTLFCLYILAQYINKDKGTALIAGVIAVISFLAGYREYYSLVITFDDENMYVTSRKFKSTVLLKQITAIKLSSSRIGNSHYWDIYYYDSLNNETTTSVLPNYKKFALFKNMVLEKNPEVKITDSIFF